MSKIIITNTVYLLFMILCFFFTLFSYFKFSSIDYMYISSIGRNWKNGPISDAEVGGYDCPLGKDSAIDDRWYGTVGGCIFTTVQNESIKRSQCSKANPGRNIPQRDPMPYRYWKGTNICV